MRGQQQQQQQRRPPRPAGMYEASATHAQSPKRSSIEMMLDTTGDYRRGQHQRRPHSHHQLQHEQLEEQEHSRHSYHAGDERKDQSDRDVSGDVMNLDEVAESALAASNASGTTDSNSRPGYLDVSPEKLHAAMGSPSQAASTSATATSPGYLDVKPKSPSNSGGTNSARPGYLDVNPERQGEHRGGSGGGGSRSGTVGYLDVKPDKTGAPGAPGGPDYGQAVYHQQQQQQSHGRGEVNTNVPLYADVAGLSPTGGNQVQLESPYVNVQVTAPHQGEQPSFSGSGGFPFTPETRTPQSPARPERVRARARQPSALSRNETPTHTPLHQQQQQHHQQGAGDRTHSELADLQELLDDM